MEDAGGREMAEWTLGRRQKSETAELMDSGLKSRANLAAWAYTLRVNQGAFAA
jgi:hypothetical protein